MVDRDHRPHNRTMKPSVHILLAALFVAVAGAGCAAHTSAVRDGPEHLPEPVIDRVPDRWMTSAFHDWCFLPYGNRAAAAWRPGIPGPAPLEGAVPLYTRSSRRMGPMMEEAVKAFREGRTRDVRNRGLQALGKGEDPAVVAVLHYLLALSNQGRPGDQRAHWRTLEGHPCLGGEAAWRLAEQAAVDGRFVDAARWYAAIPPWDDRWAGSRVGLAVIRSAMGEHDAAYRILRSLSPSRLDLPGRKAYWRALVEACGSDDTGECAGYAVRRLWHESDDGERTAMEEEFAHLAHPVGPGDRVEARLARVNSDLRTVTSVLDEAAELAGGLPGMEDYIRGTALSRVLKKRVEAVDTLRRAMAALRDPLHRARAHYQLGHVLGRLGREAEGLPELLRAAELGRGQPVHEKTLWRLSRMFRHLGRPGDTNAALKELARRFPGSRYGPRFTWSMAWSAYRDGRLDEALEHLEILASRHGHEYNGMAQPRHAQAVYWAGRIRWDQGKREAARNLYSQVTARWPLSHYAWMARRELGETVIEPWPGIEDPDPEQKFTDPGFDGISLAPDPALARPVMLARIGLTDQAVAGFTRMLDGHMPAGGVDALVALMMKQGRESLARATFRRHLSHLSLPTPDLRWFWRMGLSTPFGEEFEAASKSSGMPRSLLYAIGYLESSFDPRVRSVADAVGLLQVVPSVEKRVAGRLGKRPKGLKALKAPAWNLEIGARFLADLLHMARGNLFVMAASYNAGHCRMKGWLKQYGVRHPEDFLESLPFPGVITYAKAAGMLAMAYALSHGDWNEARRVEEALFAPIPGDLDTVPDSGRDE